MAIGGLVSLAVAFRGVFYSRKHEARKLNQILAKLLEEGVQEKGVTLLLNPRLLLGHKQQLFVIWGRTRESGGQGLNVQLWLSGYNRAEGPSLKADWEDLTLEVREKILSSQEGEDFFLHTKSYYMVQA